MSASSARSEAIRSLRRQLVANHQSQSHQQTVPTGLSTFDAILPGGGIPTGSIIEFISSRSGQFTSSIALQSIRPLLTRPGCFAVIDERGDFYSIAASNLGIPLSRLLLIRPPQLKESRRIHNRSSSSSEALHSKAALWALEQTVRCPGVCAVVCWMDRSTAAVMRRLQLAVEQSGVTLILIRPSSVLHQPSFADLRLLVTPAADSTNGQTTDANQAKSFRATHTTRTYNIRLLRSRLGLQHEGTAMVTQTRESHLFCG